jgi:3-oxoacyl-[acyl-carrier protein] reductase
MKLSGATVLITGGTSGIGRAIAHSLATAGARVTVTGRDEARLRETAQALGVHAIRADVSNEADAQRAVADVIEKEGHLDVLINNAGVGSFTTLVETDRATFEHVFAVNVTGAMLMAREAAKHFIQRNSGHLINIGSTAALRGGAHGTTYYASKFALRGMTECWRAELRTHNVRVVLINPSEVITSFAEASGYPQRANASKLQAADIAHAVKAVLEMEDRGFVPELTVFATNPKE